MRTLRWFALALPLASAAAEAATIEVTFAGAITEITTEIDDGTFVIDEPVAGSFTIDAGVADGDPSPEAGDYDLAVADVAVSFGDYPATCATGYLYVRDRASGPDEIGLGCEPSGAPVGGLPIYTFYFQLYDTTHTVFSSDAIPAALDLADFDSATLSLSYIDEPFSYPVYASITSLAYTVPEPGCAAPAAAGALALLALRSRAAAERAAPPPRGRSTRAGRRPA